MNKTFTDFIEVIHFKYSTGERRFSAALYTLFAIVSLGFLSTTAHAKPFVPENLEQVLLKRTYPLLFDSKERSKIKIDEAIAQAEKFVEFGSKTSDPRYFSYAQGLLSPWWKNSNAPIKLKLLRSKIHQHSHNFKKAIAELSDILSQNPRHAQALIERANAYRVSGEYGLSLKDCKSLIILSDVLTSFNCMAQSKGMLEDPIKVASKLEKLFVEAEIKDEKQQLDILITLAQLYQQGGDYKESESYFLRALGMGEGSAYLSHQYAGLLLETKRWQEVLDFLPDSITSNLSILQRAIATKALGDKTFHYYVSQLKARFDNTLRRGDVDISKDLAMYYLYIDPKSDLALKYARLNWQHQQEFSDKALLNEAIAYHRDSAQIMSTLEASIL